MYVNKTTTTTRKQQHNKTKEQQPLSHKERNLKTHVADTMVSNILRDLQFSLNQLLKSADKWYIGILQNIIKLKNIQTFSAVLYFPVTGLDCNMIIDCRVLKSNIYICIYIYIYIYITHSFPILFDDRSKAPSKTMPTHSAIHILLLPMRVSSPVLKVVQ